MVEVSMEVMWEIQVVLEHQELETAVVSTVAVSMVAASMAAASMELESELVDQREAA